MSSGSKITFVKGLFQSLYRDHGQTLSHSVDHALRGPVTAAEGNDLAHQPKIQEVSCGRLNEGVSGRTGTDLKSPNTGLVGSSVSLERRSVSRAV